MNLSELTDKSVDYIYANLDTSRLNDWERNFVESTSEQWDRKRWLSDDQKLALGRIWDKQP